jgi:superfamily II DNA or RNA helicase
MSSRSQIYDLKIQIEGNPVFHVFTADIELSQRRSVVLGNKEATELTSETGSVAVIVNAKKATGYGSYETVFVERDQKPQCINSSLLDEADISSILETMRETWKTSIPLIKTEGGFRDAQRGALFAIFSHWTRSNLPATVVMPTGTGKTETLLATINAHSPRCSLVIVPSDPLRTQFFEKACEWGRLKSLNVADKKMAYPVVGMLRKGFKTIEGLQSFLEKSEIIVATMPILATMEPNELELISQRCDFVAVDEAHHMGAPSWARVISTFHTSRIIQFTATPFREDGRHISGDIIYTYPLSRCQEEGFFRPIEFLAVTEFFTEKIDQSICDKALDRLRQDIANGLDHALMARTTTKGRARIVYDIYRTKCPDLNPVLLYSSMKPSEKTASKNSLLSGHSKVVICVDMLGEGFDYPSLKIAAIHDPHKSLPITLQFIGRFTRSGSQNIGNASVIANIADPKMQSNISALYSQDANWDKIIKGSYEEAVNHEIDFQNFINGFVFDGISGFSLRNIHPKFSSFVYSLTGSVDFERLKLSYNDGVSYRMALNAEKHFAVIIQKENETVEWGNIAELENTNFNCFCLYHDVTNNLLFIHASGKEIPDHLVKEASSSALRLTDQKIYRCLYNINRLMITNFGLKQRLAGPIRYRQYIGLDVGQGLKDRITGNSYAAMLFGMGYENAERASAGCSLKGKIWSRDAGSLVDWSNWCTHVGSKIVNDNIDIEDIFEGILFPEQITELPSDKTIIIADWSDYIFENMYERVSVSTGGNKHSIDDCDIVFNSSTTNKMNFSLIYPGGIISYEMRLSNSVPEGFLLRSLAEDSSFTFGKETLSGVDFFKKNPPMFWFDDSSVLVEGCLYIKASQNQSTGVYDASLAKVHNWSSTNIRVESQGDEKRSDSIQRAMIIAAKAENPILLFDDDGSGEIADIIAIYNREDDLLVRLYHCKYSSEDVAGTRIKDVYEICGQAQKSVKWAGSAKDISDRIRRREKKRREAGKSTRFEVGGMQELNTFIMMSKQKRVKFEAVLVHPGISFAGLNSGTDQVRNLLRVFAATASYLLETFEIDMKLIINV